MAKSEGMDPLLNAVQETLGEYHRKIERIDEDLSRLVHRREEMVAGARLAVIEQLPEEVIQSFPDLMASQPPQAIALRSDHVAELSAALDREVDSMRDRMLAFHNEIEEIDTQLASLVHQREEHLAAARLALVDRVPPEMKGRVAELAPRVAMTLACR